MKPTAVQKIGWRTIVTKTFITPDGKQEFTLFNAEGTKCAGVVALTPDNKVVIARQYRAGPEKLMDEVPGGAVEAGEAPQAAALRELQEETGYQPETITYLGRVYKDAYNNSTWYYYLATDCHLTAAGQNLDSGEFVEVDLVDINHFLANAREGRMTDVEAVLLAYDELKKRLVG